MSKLYIEREVALIDEASREILVWSQRIRKYLIAVLIVTCLGAVSTGFIAALASKLDHTPGGVYISCVCVLLFTSGAGVAMSSILRASSRSKVRAASELMNMVNEIHAAVLVKNTEFVPSADYIKMRCDVILTLGLPYSVSLSEPKEPPLPPPEPEKETE